MIGDPIGLPSLARLRLFVRRCRWEVKMVARTGFLLLIAIVGAGFLACSEPPKPAPPGSCQVNSDCKGGFRCHAGWCEDIFHPRGTIIDH